MSPGQLSTSWTSFGLWLIIQFLLLNVVLGAMLCLSTALSIVAANIVLVILCVSIVATASIYKRASLWWCALVTLVAGIIAGFALREYLEATRGEILKDIKIAQAANHPSATGFTFSDGRIRSDLAGVYEDRTRPKGRAPTIRFFCAAPLVTEDWGTSMPATVWVVAKSSSSPNDWEKPFKAGLRPPSWEMEGFGKAILAACQSHGLVAPDTTIAIYKVESPEQAIDALLSEFWFGVKFWNIMLVVGLLIGRIVVVARARKKAAARG